MGESGVVFLLVPFWYGIASVTLLLAAIVVAFVPKWRFLSAYFLAAAVAAVPAFVLWLGCLYCCEKLATFIENNSLSLAGSSLVIPLMLSTFAAAIACFALGVFVSAKMIFKWTHDDTPSVKDWD